MCSAASPGGDGGLAANARDGLTFGSALRADTLNEPDLRALVVENCATITAELEMKWAAIAPMPDGFTYSAADRIAAFAVRHGLRLRGHTLLWHESIPDWLAAELSRAPDWTLIDRHIAAVVRRYRELVDEWDVVNEPIDTAAGNDGLRHSPFFAAFGPDYIARALSAAQRAAPRARLMINEFGLEYATDSDRARRAALLALARSLKRDGAPLHGIGIQAHLNLANGPIAHLELIAFLSALGDLGLTVSITELDVKERDYILPAAERDRLVAEHVAEFLGVVLESPIVRSISCWGLSSRQSWLSVGAEDRARFPGAWTDGSSPGLNRGLPFDERGRRNPMGDAIARALAA